MTASIADIAARLRAAVEDLPDTRLEYHRRRLSDEVRPMLHHLLEESWSIDVNDVLGLLDSAAEDLADAAALLRQAASHVDAWVRENVSSGAAEAPAGDGTSAVQPGVGPRGQAPTSRPGDTAPETTPADGRAWPGRPRGMPLQAWLNIQRGQRFNVARRPFYVANEVRLRTGKRVDSYKPGEEIVERKHTQLADVSEATAVGYLQDIVRKYSPGERISDTPRNRERYPDLVGEVIDGQMILEVPVQYQPVPRSILEKAAELDVIIRDVDGKEYEL